MREFFSLKNHHSVVPLCGFEVSRATKGAPCSACVNPYLPKATCGDYEVPDKVRVSFPSVLQSLRVSVQIGLSASQIAPETVEYVKDTIQVILNGYGGLEASGSLVPGTPSCRWHLPSICTTVKIDDDDHSTNRHLTVKFSGGGEYCTIGGLCSPNSTPTDWCNKETSKIQAIFDPTSNNTFSLELVVCCLVLQDPAYGCEGTGYTVTMPMSNYSHFRYVSQRLDPPFEFPIKLDLDDQWGFGIGPPTHIFLEEML